VSAPRREQPERRAEHGVDHGEQDDQGRRPGGVEIEDQEGEGGRDERLDGREQRERDALAAR
jgi:hypothetical protein